MRRDGVVQYLHGDHLGSTSLATNGTGEEVLGSRTGYIPFGEMRYGEPPTDRRFTGQRHEAGLGLYDYNARFYDPALGRFVSADTIVPQPGNPQDLNRYAYARNNPLKYSDPSGHYVFEEYPGDLWTYSSAAVRSARYYTHPEYEHGQVSDRELFFAAMSPILVPAALAIAPSCAVPGAISGAGYVLGSLATGQELDPINALLAFYIGGIGLPGEGGVVYNALWTGGNNLIQYLASSWLKGEAVSGDEMYWTFAIGTVAGGGGTVAQKALDTRPLVQRGLGGYARVLGEVLPDVSAQVGIDALRRQTSIEELTVDQTAPSTPASLGSWSGAGGQSPYVFPWLQ